MAGVKGRSGGARPNSGPKPKGAVPQGDKDMLEFLVDVALGRTDASALQVRAAVAAVQYTHTKTHDGGKKEEKQRAAEKAAGRFKVSHPPLRAVS